MFRCILLPLSREGTWNKRRNPGYGTKTDKDFSSNGIPNNGTVRSGMCSVLINFPQSLVQASRCLSSQHESVFHKVRVNEIKSEFKFTLLFKPNYRVVGTFGLPKYKCPNEYLTIILANPQGSWHICTPALQAVVVWSGSWDSKAKTFSLNSISAH